MADLEYENIIDLCRACLQIPDEFCDVNEIYDEEGNLSLAECFSFSTNFSFFDDSLKLPQNLCKTCAFELHTAYDFLKRVRNSDAILQEWLIKQQSYDTPPVGRTIETRENGEIFCDIVEDDENGLLRRQNNNSPQDVWSFAEDEKKEIYCDTSNDNDSLFIQQERSDTPSNDQTHEPEEIYYNKTAYDNDGNELTAVEISQEYILSQEDLEYKEEYSNNDADDDNNDEGSADFIMEQIDDEDSEKTETEELESTTVIQDDGKDVFSKFNKESPQDSGRHSDTGTSEVDSIVRDETASIARENTQAKGMGQFQCDICDKVFSHYSRMTTHRQRHDPNREKLQCSECLKFYSTKLALQVHKQSMHQQCGHQCPLCKKVFAIEKALEIHMRFHTRNFPYVCEICDKRYAQASHLKTHNNVAHKKLYYTCPYPECAKQFTSSYSLRNHEFTHTEMPFECAHCKRGYPAKTKLKVHLKVCHKIECSLDSLETMRKFYVTRSTPNMAKRFQTDKEKTSAHSKKS